MDPGRPSETLPRCSNDTQDWYTWPASAVGGKAVQGAGIVNIGERGRMLNGQRFVNAAVRWGEIGLGNITRPIGYNDFSSGPTGPAFGTKWTMGAKPRVTESAGISEP